MARLSALAKPVDGVGARLALARKRIPPSPPWARSRRRGRDRGRGSRWPGSELAHVSARRKTDWQGKVLPTVNAFMVSDEFRGAHITTGTVLRGSDGTYWLCASPACDLVPRASAPVMVQMIRLVIERAPREKFTPGEYVIIGGLDGPVILRALEVKTRQPSLAVLILPHGTRVSRPEATSVPTILGWIVTDDSLRRSSAVLAVKSL